MIIQIIHDYYAFMTFDIRGLAHHHVHLSSFSHKDLHAMIKQCMALYVSVCVYTILYSGLYLLLIITMFSCFPTGKHSPCTSTEVSNSTAILSILMYFIITCLRCCWTIFTSLVHCHSSCCVREDCYRRKLVT